jgi:ArsR family transcriptional regulator, lead/cadmium/zinc/bismuth-responsive transcriptional repressor
MEMHMNETTSQLAKTPVGETLIDPDMVEAAKRRLATGPAIEDVARQFALMADSTRLRMLTALDAGELCVNDLSAATGINRSTVSHQLKVLRDARLVRTRREGKVIYYALDDDHVVSLMAMASAHLLEEEKSK